MSASNPEIYVQPTPNPNALKFVLDQAVKTEGNSTYRNPQECGENNLAAAIFTVPGVAQIYFFDNVITVNKLPFDEWEALEPQIIDVIKEQFPSHNPDYVESDPEKERRAALSEDLQKIEGILDKTIRPGLQGDGGDIQTLNYDNNILLVRYQGACGSCPSAMTGTLEAIKAILRDQFDPDIDVYVAPEF